MSTLDGDRLIKTRNLELPILLFSSCNRQPNTQRVQKSCKRPSTQFPACKHQEIQNLLHLFYKICQPGAEWCHLAVSLWRQPATISLKKSLHRTQWMELAVALLLKHPSSQSPWWRGQQAPLSHQPPWPILRVMFLWVSLEVPIAS